MAEDKLSAIAHAIGKAEGFGLPGAIPTKRNNPGDLVAAGHIASYATAAAGWTALDSLLVKIEQGQSKYYTTAMTWVEMGRVYAAGDPHWAKNVAATLGVEPGSTIDSYLKAQAA